MPLLLFLWLSPQWIVQVLAPHFLCSLARAALPQHRSASWFRSAQQSVAPDRKKRHSIHFLTASLLRRFLRRVNLALCRCLFFFGCLCNCAASTCAPFYAFSRSRKFGRVVVPRYLVSFGTTRRCTRPQKAPFNSSSHRQLIAALFAAGELSVLLLRATLCCVILSEEPNLCMC